MTTATSIKPRRTLEYIFKRHSRLEWKPLSSRQLQDHNFLPNRIMQNLRTKAVAIVLKRGPTGSFSLGEPVVDYYTERMREGRVKTADIILLEADGSYIANAPFMDVVEDIGDYPPNVSTTPGWCDYWWIKDDFHLSTNEEFREQTQEML